MTGPIAAARGEGVEVGDAGGALEEAGRDEGVGGEAELEAEGAGLFSEITWTVGELAPPPRELETTTISAEPSLSMSATIGYSLKVPEVRGVWRRTLPEPSKMKRKFSSAYMASATPSPRKIL